MFATKLNPHTGKLELVSNGSTSITFYKKPQTVDAGFLITPDITLQAAPLTDSEIVFLNGLFIDDTNYSIAGSILTMVTAELRVGDILNIHFAS